MKQVRHFLIIAVLALIVSQSRAQVGVGITTPNSSAQLDITATGKGLLIPRMTSANLPSSPATGLIIYQTDGTSGFYYYDGSSWKMISNTTTAATAFNDTLIRNLYTAGYLVTADGATGIKMYSNGILVDTGTYGAGTNLRVSGAGTRMIWYPKGGAFRAGSVASTNWDSSNIGNYSAAFGYNNKANGNYSFAAGEGNLASGAHAFAAGYQCSATSNETIAMGQSVTASGTTAVALGKQNTASGNASTALGENCVTSGSHSFGVGQSITANGSYSNAIGYYISTNNKGGAMILSDSTSTITSNDANNQLMGRFTGGYKLYSNSSLTQGMTMATNGATTIGTSCIAGGSGAIAAGSTDTASGTQSVSLGAANKASNTGAVAIGYQNTATGSTSVSMGNTNSSSGNGSIALGFNTISSGWGSAAIGLYSTASNTASVALGSSNTSSGQYSTAMGYISIASGNNSVAIGTKVSTNNKAGSFVFGDSTASTLTTNDAVNQMMMRFNGGYKLYTNSTGTQGAQLTNAGVLKYMNNVSGSYDTRSLTDKGYVDSVVSASATATTFDDTLLSNLYTNGFLVSADGTTGIKMYSNGTLVDTGSYGSGNTLSVSGAGTRMFWYPRSAAFRAGKVTGTQWDISSIGSYSSAFGIDNTANATASVAFGNTDTASGQNSFVAGSGSKSSGNGSTSFGSTNQSTGVGSFAAGTNSKSTSWGSVTLGIYNTASNTASVAMGSSNIASGQYAFALGHQANATGDNSVAIGYNVSTNNQAGSFILGDSSTSLTNNDTANQMVMRFANGYKLYTNSSASVGTQLVAGGNSWSTISDRRKKENFAPVVGEDFLNKISKMPLSSWNYKGQNSNIFRHYGPMAQDFFAAFGKDKYGTSGNDTTINQADMEGVTFIAVQALEKRTHILQQENADLKNEMIKLKADYESRLGKIEAEISQCAERKNVAPVK